MIWHLKLPPTFCLFEQAGQNNALSDSIICPNFGDFLECPTLEILKLVTVWYLTEKTPSAKSRMVTYQCQIPKKCSITSETPSSANSSYSDLRLIHSRKTDSLILTTKTYSATQVFYSWGVDTVSDSVSNLYFPCGIDPCISYHATLILSACLVGAPYDCTTRPVLRILSVFSDISVQGDNICGLLEIWVRDIYTRWLKKDWGIAVRKSYSGQRMVEPFCIILLSLCSCESSIQHKWTVERRSIIILRFSFFN